MADNDAKPEATDPVTKILEQIGVWMEKDDKKPRQLRLSCQPIMTPTGPGRVFQLHEETILAQLTEAPEPSRIVPVGAPVPPPNGVPRG